VSLVTPPVPIVRGRVPFVGAGVRFLRNPTAFLAQKRREVGDTFLLEAFGMRLLFLFSPAGLASLYRLPEEDASFTEATRTLIGFKLPPELLGADMRMFHKLFGRERREGYLVHIEGAVRESIAGLAEQGELEIFGHMKRLVHRVGFRCWAGPEASSPRYLERLVTLFERLDPEAAFVSPAQTAITLLTRKAPERRALREVEAILREIHESRVKRGAREGDMLDELHELHAALSDDERHANVARDVMILHLASLSNLYAAMGWTLVNLLLSPPHLAAAEDEHAGPFVEQCAEESIRLAQRSITLRKVMRECSIDDGAVQHRVSPGVFIATMLSVTNSDGVGLDRFDPGHYAREGRSVLTVPIPSRETVSTFGHGKHACPGQRFALSAIRIAVLGYLDALELTPSFDSAAPRPEQIGAVARAAAPCVVRYRKRRRP
jgi:cytochrome P450